MSYIDSDYLSLQMGVGEFSGSLRYAGTPANLTGSLVTQVIAQACSYCDAFFAPTYDVPLTTTPPVVQFWAATKATEILYLRCGKPIPEAVSFAVASNESQLVAVMENRLTLPGVPRSTAGAVAGGHSSSPGDEDTSDSAGCSTSHSYEPLMSRQKLRNVM